MAKKKQIILHAATILFAEKGFSGTSIAELAQITDSAEGTIFYHFKTKADLFIGILADVRTGIIREFNDYISQRTFKTGLEMMENIISFFLYLATYREEWFRLLQRHFPYEYALKNDECRMHLESIYNTLVEFFEQAIVKGMADGSIKTTDPGKIGVIIFSLINGLLWLKFKGIFDTAILYDELLKTCREILVKN